MTKIISMNSKNLLLVVPHLRVFIKDQATLIKPYFGSVTALMPVPYFSSIAMRLPIVNKNFHFLQFTLDSMNDPKQDFGLLSPKFFTLPIEVVRKKSFYTQTERC